MDPDQSDPGTILRLLPHGVLVVASDWRILYANPEATKLLGEKGRTLWERCPDLEHTAFASGFRYAMADQTELLTESALPTVGWCQARARPTPEGGLLISLRQVHPHTLETGQAKQALLIGEMGDALTREDSMHSALKRCTDALIRNLDAALARVWTIDQASQTLELCASAGIQVQDDQVTIPLGDGKIGQIAEEAQPYLTNEVMTDGDVGTEWTRRDRVISFAGYPLRVEDRIVGVLALYSRRALDHDMLNALSVVADTLALGIDRKTADAARRRLESQLRAQADRLAILHELGKQLSAELDSQVLVQKVIDAATKLAGAQIGAFFFHTTGRTGATITNYALCGVGRETFEQFALPRMTPMLAPTFTGEKIVRIDDVTEHEAFGKVGPHFGLPPGHVPVTSYLGVPVKGRNQRLLGVILVGHEQRAMFSEETGRLIAGVAATAAIAMDNARLFKDAHDLIAALEKSNHELDQFAYVASHDLKAPLRGIANLSQWIEDDLGDRMDDQTRQHMHLLRGRVIRLENLIGGILAYSRAGRDRENAEIELAPLVKEVWELLAAPANVKFKVATKLPTLTGSRVQLQQVLMNLIGNAVKYNREREVHVEVGARYDHERWILWVKDDGIGIAPEFHEKVWGLFQTLERRDKVESTGIGLSVVRKIVESHGGKTWVDSAPGTGATFSFTWPADSKGEQIHG